MRGYEEKFESATKSIQKASRKFRENPTVQNRANYRRAKTRLETLELEYGGDGPPIRRDYIGRRFSG